MESVANQRPAPPTYNTPIHTVGPLNFFLFGCLLPRRFSPSVFFSTTHHAQPLFPPSQAIHRPPLLSPLFPPPHFPSPPGCAFFLEVNSPFPSPLLSSPPTPLLSSPFFSSSTSSLLSSASFTRGRIPGLFPRGYRSFPVS